MTELPKLQTGLQDLTTTTSSLIQTRSPCTKSSNFTVTEFKNYVGEIKKYVKALMGVYKPLDILQIFGMVDLLAKGLQQ